MARVTVSDVKTILPTGFTLTDPQIQAAIDAATLQVDELAASSCGENLSDDMLTQIEKWLSAHMAAAIENDLSMSSEKSTCGGSTTYGFKFGEGIKGTPYGQMANSLSGGCLAEFDKQPVNFFSIGSHGDAESGLI